MLVALVAGVLRFYLRKLLIGVSRHVELDLRNDLFAHLQRLPAAFYNRHRTGDLLARMTSDLESVRSVLGPGIMYPMDTITMAIFSLTMMVDPLAAADADRRAHRAGDFAYRSSTSGASPTSCTRGFRSSFPRSRRGRRKISPACASSAPSGRRRANCATSTS